MLYVIYGKDFKRSRANLNRLKSALLKKKPDSNLFVLSEDNFSGDQLEGFVGSQGLFEQKYIVVLDKCLENKEYKEIILSQLKEISKSDNIFICIEEKIDKKTLRKLEKAAEKLHEHGEIASTIKDEFKLFTLTDALGRRDRKKVWIEYQKAIMNGASAEEVYSMLIWQIRSIVLAGESKNATESGLKPFVYNKSKDFSKNYSKEGVRSLYTNLVSSYHESRRGGLDLNESIEKILLGV